MPKVSIIVPAWNYGHLIGETLSAVQRQSFADWECLVVDDGSSDGTSTVVQAAARLDERIIYVRRPHTGPSGTRNAGIAIASGSYLQFLDADDLLEPCKLERQADFLDHHAAVDIVYGEVRYFRDDARDERTFAWDGGGNDWTQRIRARGEAAIAALLRANITTIHAPLVRREVIQGIGGFDESMTDAEDWDLWLRCALAGASFHHEAWPDTMALVRSHRGSTSRNRARMLNAEITMRRKVHARLSPPLQAVNGAGLNEARFRLRLEQALEEPTAFRRLRRLLRAGAGQGSARGVAHALALPLARNPLTRNQVSFVLNRLRRRKPG